MKYRTTFIKRLLVSFLAYSLIGTQLLQTAHATDLADIPLAVRNLSQPNIMFMIDSSGSMLNVVVENTTGTTAYNPATTYIANCPANNLIPAGSAVDLRIVASTPRILFGGTNFVLGTVVTDPVTQRCFDSISVYPARLNADNAGQPSGYFGSDYPGNYLNWYFNQGNTAPTWTAGQAIKPGTQSRITIARASAVTVVNNLNNVRVGLSTYNGDNGGTLRVQMGVASAAQKTTMANQINNFTVAGPTPLAETLSDIGRYFTTGYNGNLTLRPGPGSTTASLDSIFTTRVINNATGTTPLPNPIQFYCQKSFAVLLTDGRPQADRAISDSLTDYTGDCSASVIPRLCDPTSDGVNIPAGPLPTPTGRNNGTKPGRSYEILGSDYLDDVALAMFDMDLRPDLQPPTNTNITKGKNNLSTYVIGFADSALQGDALLNATATRGSGTGAFFTANPAELNASFQTIIEDITRTDSAAAAVAVANANIEQDNSSYASSYVSGAWTGDLERFPIDVSTSIVSTTRTWSARDLLNPRTSASRFIATHNGLDGASGGGAQFQPTTASTSTKLSADQQTSLNTPAAAPLDGAAVVAYLRGDRSGDTTGTPKYRRRAFLLGDIINAEPVVVRNPSFNYSDAGYNAFRAGTGSALNTAAANRPIMVYQGANDGMLHGFDAATGVEKWAYIPNLVIPRLNLRTRLVGFTHEFYVDGTPTAGDVDFGQTSTAAANAAPDWRTILVGGLNKGGRGYYALDVTNPVLPANTEEADLATKVLWEFPNSIVCTTTTSSKCRPKVLQNMGFSYGNPIIVKTASRGWVVLVTSGYNNGTPGDGRGYLYVIDAKTGDLIEAISTNVGSATNPSGLGKISAYVEDGNVDNTTRFAYGGDLFGNVWRFDLSGNPNTWSVTRLATLVDANGLAQPVTTAPELARINLNGTDRFLVYVGTGKYLGDTDLVGLPGVTPNINAAQTQTIYGLLDDRTSTPLISPLRSSLQQQTLTDATTVVAGVVTPILANGVATQVLTSNTVNYTTQKGFYVDLPGAGERIFVDSTLGEGVLVFNSNTPSTVTCIPGGSSKQYALDYANGGLVAGQAYSVTSFPDALSSRAVLVKRPSGAVDALTRQSDKDTITTSIPSSGSVTGTRRINWREIISQ